MSQTMQPFRQFLDHYRTVSFRKGDLILRQHEVPDHVFVIKLGVIKTYNLTNEGDEKPISFDVPNEMFPVSWAFEKSSATLHYYEAFTDCELYAIPRDDYRDFLRANPEVMFKILNHFVGNHVSYMMHINALEQSRASAKLLHTLHYLCLRFGKEIRVNQVSIQLALTQQDLANYMGVRRETAALELKKLEQQKVVSVRRTAYEVDMRRLSQLLDEDEHDVIDLITW